MKSDSYLINNSDEYHKKIVRISSGHCCPECKSLNYFRIHRGFISKYILMVRERYQCGNCEVVFTNRNINKNKED